LDIRMVVFPFYSPVHARQNVSLAAFTEGFIAVGYTE
jgi:hypothetical protein